jgi:hypothetical protein
MTVYVDSLSHRGWRLRGHLVRSSHMIADSISELHEMAKRIGMKRDWFQSNASTVHYDLTEKRRTEALKLGAVELDRLSFVQKIRELRNEPR